jgi:hypothetical protein
MLSVTVEQQSQHNELSLLMSAFAESVLQRPGFFRNTYFRKALLSSTLPGNGIHNDHLRAFIRILSRGTEIPPSP